MSDSSPPRNELRSSVRPHIALAASPKLGKALNVKYEGTDIKRGNRCQTDWKFGAPEGTRTPRLQIRSRIRGIIRGTDRENKVDFPDS